MRFICFIILLGCYPSSAIGQVSINQFDDRGQRHGIWKKYYDGSEQLRYEGQFEHGREVGTFKFYCDECKDQPMVIKEFANDGKTAKTSYYTIKGKLVSQGEMAYKDRVGEWLFYHEISQQVMTREHYRKGLLHGKKTTYYSNGNRTEELNYIDGKIHGPAYYYGPNGELLKELNFVYNELHGKAIYYDAHGTVVIRGNYKHGAKHGLWEYFENGNKIMEETFPKKHDDK